MNKPKRLDPHYLRGWFQIETNGNARLAAKLAAQYIKKSKSEKACTS